MVTNTQYQQAVQAENERLNKIDVEKLRVRLEEVSSLKRAQAKNTQDAIDRNAKLQERIEEIQAEAAKLQFNEVTLADIAPEA